MKKGKISKGAYALTVVNILILLFSLFCLWKIRQTWKQINAAELPTYREAENETLEIELPSGKQVNVFFGKKAAEVEACYLTSSREDIISVICAVKAYSAQYDITFPRETADMIGEYRLHVFLYRIGYKPEQTGDAAIDYIEDHRWYVNAFSRLLGMLGL